MRGENRGQSNIIGAILVFGFIVAAIGANQTVLVPQANEEIEFKHSKQVQSDMVNLRSNIISAAGNNDFQSTSLRLGPQYPNRYLAINPPEPAGTLSSADAGEIKGTNVNVSAVCGTEGDPVETDYLNYNINYNEQNSLPITYDNSVVHRQEISSGQVVFDSGQSIVSGNTIRLLPIKADVSRSSTQTTSVDVFPSDTGRTSVTTDFYIEFPSKLTATQWNELISSSYVDSITKSSGNINISFKNPSSVAGLESYQVRCTYVGVEEQPNVNPVDRINNDTSPDDQQFNPTGELRYDSASIQTNGNTNEVDVTFDNKFGEGVEIYEARVPFYSVSGQGQSGSSINPPDIAEIPPNGITLDIAGDSQFITNRSVNPGGSITYTIEFENTNGNGNGGSGYTVKQGDWFFLTLTYEKDNGEIITSRYLIVPEN